MLKTALANIMQWIQNKTLYLKTINNIQECNNLIKSTINYLIKLLILSNEI